MANNKKLSTDEKLDLILKYQKKQFHWTVFRAISFWVLFVVLVVVPVVWSVQFIRNFTAAGGIQGIQGTFQELQESAKQFGQFESLLKQLGQ